MMDTTGYCVLIGPEGYTTQPHWMQHWTFQLTSRLKATNIAGHERTEKEKERKREGGRKSYVKRGQDNHTYDDDDGDDDEEEDDDDDYGYCTRRAEKVIEKQRER